MTEFTTIRVTKETASRLYSLKKREENYDEIIVKMIKKYIKK